MHHIHHTHAFVISHKDLGEANRLYTIFTKELGMVTATAQGVRKMSSKLRFTLQSGTYIKVDFVRGKEMWRITSASPLESFDSRDTARNIVWSRILGLLARLTQGEESHPQVFSHVFTVFETIKNVPEEELANFEIICFIKLLFSFGYWEIIEGDESIVVGSYNKEMFDFISGRRTVLVSRINNSLSASQL